MTRRKQRGKSRQVCCVAVDTGKTAATIYEQLISIKERARREGRKENAVRKLPIEKKEGGNLGGVYNMNLSTW